MMGDGPSRPPGSSCDGVFVGYDVGFGYSCGLPLLLVVCFAWLLRNSEGCHSSSNLLTGMLVSRQHA
ncbi:hypothetical protein EI42_06466 [Thermosporothrix hazakensis]|uniref:Uncharacterized protein n=1 Tax=Thermosporothrix hazakensis TaxID=644383 RepID=A0A326TL60_THEHA|nr:hypothetical protein EI42_06466 [Thermosporothrix hazakensis]